MGHSRPLFLLFSSFLEIIRMVNMFIIIICWWSDSNRRPMVSESSALPTVPQPLPSIDNLWTVFTIKSNRWCLQFIQVTEYQVKAVCIVPNQLHTNDVMNLQLLEMLSGNLGSNIYFNSGTKFWEIQKIFSTLSQLRIRDLKFWVDEKIAMLSRG